MLNLIFMLFKTFFLLGAFSFGGGMASMELIRSRVVTQHGWLTNSEFTDLISISEMTPGPLGINIASFTGTQIAGVPGMIVSTVGYVTAPIVIVLIMAHFYFRYRKLSVVDGVLKGLRPAIVAMIFSSAYKLVGNAWWDGMDHFSVSLLLTNTNWVAVVLSIVALICLQRKLLGPIQVILLCGIVGAVIYGLYPA